MLNATWAPAALAQPLNWPGTVRHLPRHSCTSQRALAQRHHPQCSTALQQAPHLPLLCVLLDQPCTRVPAMVLTRKQQQQQWRQWHHTHHHVRCHHPSIRAFIHKAPVAIHPQRASDRPFVTPETPALCRPPPQHNGSASACWLYGMRANREGPCSPTSLLHRDTPLLLPGSTHTPLHVQQRVRYHPFLLVLP